MSHPSFESVNSYIDSEFSSVKHSALDHAISLIQRLGKVLEYLELTIDTVNMLVKIPDDKILELKEKTYFVLKSKKVTLKVLQSIVGSLACCTRAEYLAGGFTMQ